MKHKKRSLLSLFLALLLCMGSLISVLAIPATAEAIKADTAFDGGDGSQESPYLIADAGSLLYFASVINDSGTTATYANKHFKLTNNITFNTGKAADWAETAPENTWTPIGNTKDTPFKGTFDGNGYTISGIYVSKSASRVGLFGQLNGGTIKNLAIDNSFFKCTKSGDNDNLMGSLVGYISEGTVNIENCNSSSIVYGAGKGIGGFIGQIAKGASVTVNRCIFSGSATAEHSLIGGILGNDISGATIKNCRVKNATLSSTATTGDVSVGGIIGKCGSVASTVQDCQVSATINAVSNCVGGIIGYVNYTGTRVIGCSFSGSATTTGTTEAGQYVGGIVGYINSDKDTIIENCTNYADITSAYRRAGGLVGQTFANTTIKNSINYGKVSAPTAAGLLVGRNTSEKTFTFTNCYYIGTSKQNLIGEEKADPATDLSKCKKLDFVISTVDGASIRLGNPTGMRFIAKVDINAYNKLIEEGATVSYGTIIAPKGESSPAELHKAGDTSKYLDIKATAGTWFAHPDDSVNTYIAGSIANIKSANYTKDFTAVAYCTVTIGDESVTIYSSTECTRNVAEVANEALNDNTANYTQEQKAILEGFCEAAT